MRFRKKPVEVEAWRWDPSEPHELLRLLRSSPVKGPSFPHDEFPDFKLARFDHDGRLIFYCLKSDALCTIAAGDWVIAESDGVGYYPCTAQMFEATYVDVSAPAPAARPPEAIHVPRHFFDLEERPTIVQSLAAEALGEMVDSSNKLIGQAGAGKSWIWARFVRYLYRTDVGVRDAIDNGLLTR